jgi:hypothetical protein
MALNMVGTVALGLLFVLLAGVVGWVALRRVPAWAGLFGQRSAEGFRKARSR